MDHTVARPTPPAPRAESWTLAPRASQDEITRQIEHDLQSNYHYDMPIELWQYIMGPAMKYSCGLWDAEHNTLASAQDAHLAAVVESLRLTPDSHVLDVGAGWGPFSGYAAKHSGCRVDGHGRCRGMRVTGQQRHNAKRRPGAQCLDGRAGRAGSAPAGPGQSR